MIKNSPQEVSLLVKGLSKSFGSVEVLQKLNLTVSKGAVHGLVGLNGSGKTTTLECLLGLKKYNNGEVSVLGYQPSQLFQANGSIVAIFDTPCLHPNLSVRQVLELARKLCPSPVRSSKEVETLLGISRYSHYKVKHLSLGNRRRTSIAQALLGKPEFILMDEPFNGLDAEGVDDVLALIKHLNQKEEISFLLSSHQLPYLEQICSHLSILHKGEIILSDEITNIFDNKQGLLSINCDDTSQAISILQNNAEISIVNLAELEERKFPKHMNLEIELRSVSSAKINQLLVSQGLAVHELIIQKHTLSALFRSMTSESET